MYFHHRLAIVQGKDRSFCYSSGPVALLESFSCRDTEKLFNDKGVRRFQSFERQARKRLMVLHAAPSLEALMLNPGNKFHALGGNGRGNML